MYDETSVSIECCEQYCSEFPYVPGEFYPEYPFGDSSRIQNPVYKAVRNHLFNLGLDEKNFGSHIWNPFKKFELINKAIVIKPNWVIHFHPAGDDIWSVITHPSFIRVVLDYIYIATLGKCHITIGDSPVQSADFNKIIEICRMKELQEYFRDKGMNIFLEDFRLDQAMCGRNGLINKIVTLSNDLKKCRMINLFSNSLHSENDFKYKRYRVTNYNKRKMINHHYPNNHQYLISSTVLKSSFVVNIPKMKTHHKAGVSLSLKNMVGICCSKDWLPHHLRGPKAMGFDEYENRSFLNWFATFFIEMAELYGYGGIQKHLIIISRILLKIQKIIAQLSNKRYDTEGSWFGNDTIWRTCLDINRIMFFADEKGNMVDSSYKKKYLTLIDGIVGGEKESPLKPTPIASRFTVAAFNPTVADYITAMAMGLDPLRIPIIRNSMSIKKFPIFNSSADKITVRSSNKSLDAQLGRTKVIKKFEPSSGWKNCIELQ